MDDTFLDLISKCQGRRLDDQRSEFPSPTSSDRNSSASSQMSGDEEDLFDTLWRLQGSRLEEQRCQLPPLESNSAWQEPEGDSMSTDELFELIFASQVSIIGGVMSSLTSNVDNRQFGRSSTLGRWVEPLPPS